MAVSTVVGTRGLPSAPSSDPALPLTPLRLPGGVLSLWESPHVPARDSRRPLSSSREMCDQSHNITMCPLCDKTCSYWKMSSACATARASHLFDNPATVFFSVFMALWGERAEAPGGGGGHVSFSGGPQAAWAGGTQAGAAWIQPHLPAVPRVAAVLRSCSDPAAGPRPRPGGALLLETDPPSRDQDLLAQEGSRLEQGGPGALPASLT